MRCKSARSRGVLVVSVFVVTSALAQERASWRSQPSVTFTNPALAGAELSLSLEIGRDGHFKGSWGQYLCTSYPGAYGIAIMSCSGIAGGSVEGVLEGGGHGVARLSKLGESAFEWRVDERGVMTIEFPRTWQDAEAPVLYQAHLTMGGVKPLAKSQPVDERPSSSVAVYREFVKDSAGALRRYQGRVLELEGRRGTLIKFSDGIGGAIHVPDGTQPRALVLMFDSIDELRSVPEGAMFRFRCTLSDFDYQYVQLRDCTRLE